ncbi:MAG TPA: ribulokinase [Cyclobacteriaceae bacterium]|nr:ribulokinase [Cyclobacteriaceae bacterium]
MTKNYVIGLDFGTDSVRAVLVDSGNGSTLATHVHGYKRWREGKYCDASQSMFRQHVLDHLEGIESTITTVVSTSGVDSKSIKGICIDTTGSSPVPVDEHGVALCLKPEFEHNPNAMMVLWKDHTAIQEAEEINQLARSWGGIDYTRFEGGIYSSEWFWAKILHIIRKDEKIKCSAVSWMEHCDLMTYILTGSNDLRSFKRSRCAAGHKAMWHESWNGLPAEEFMMRLDPSFKALRKNLYENTYTSDQVAGNLSEEWAKKLGLTTDTILAVGTFDAHAGAVGAEVGEHTLVRVMGTSTCDIIVSPASKVSDTIRGICGQVNGSVIPDMIGLEAGQSAFGDLLAWFRDIVAWPIDNLFSVTITDREKLDDEIVTALSIQAEKLPISESAPLALDWINGRRTPDANQALKASIINLNLGTNAPAIFRALVEAICFGSKKIVDRFVDEGVEIKSVVGVGGVAKKSPFVMQTLADVLNMPIKVASSEQAPALGAAMYAATAAGLYKSITQASKAMGNGFEKVYQPNPKNISVYAKRYETYCQLGDYVEKNTNA